MSILAHISTIDRENLFNTSLFSIKKINWILKSRDTCTLSLFYWHQPKNTFTSSFIDQNDFL